MTSTTENKTKYYFARAVTFTMATLTSFGFFVYYFSKNNAIGVLIWFAVCLVFWLCFEYSMRKLKKELGTDGD